MSLTETLDALDDLLPAGESLLFRQPSPVQQLQFSTVQPLQYSQPSPVQQFSTVQPLQYSQPSPVQSINAQDQDAFTSLDLPDIANFSMDDVTFGDLEFLDLATLPLDRNKNKNPTMGAYPDIYFNSIATPSGYCSTNFLIEEHNRLTLLLSETDTVNERTTFTDDIETVGKGILDNLFDQSTPSASVKSGKRCTVDEQLPDVNLDDIDSNPKSILNDDVTYEVPMEVLNLMAKNFESLQQELDHTSVGPVAEIETCPVVKTEKIIPRDIKPKVMKQESYRTVTIQSIRETSDSEPPPGTVAKIMIVSKKRENTTQITISSTDGSEGHSFEINTANVQKATQALRSLNLDSMAVLRKILRLGPIAPSQPTVKSQPEEDPDVIEFETVEGSDELVLGPDFDDNIFYPDPGDPQELIKQITSEQDSTLQSSLAQHGISVSRFVCVVTASGKKYWVCPDKHCRKAFSKCYQLKMHVLGHYNVKPFKCDEPGCSWAFFTMTKLKRHKESHSRKKAFSCQVEGCDKKFSTVYNLNAHLKLHNREAQFACSHPNCGQRFQTQRAKDGHETRCNGGGVYPDFVCPIPRCGKTLASMMKLQAHLKNHQTNEPLNKCPYPGCDKVFDKPSRLKAHEVYHTGEKPYACDVLGCSWRFPSSSKLARHKRSHTNERKYQCPYEMCNKSFIRSEHLKEHLMSHSGVRNFNCPVDGCDKTFSVKSAIYNHVKKKHILQDDPMQVTFKCPVPECSKRYVSKAAFRCHISKVHSSEFVLADQISLSNSTTTGHQESPANQLDFIALLSSVGEDLGSEGAPDLDPGLLHLVEVGNVEGLGEVEVEAVPQCTVTLPGLDPLPIHQLGQISIQMDVPGGDIISIPLSQTSNMVSIPLSQTSGDPSLVSIPLSQTSSIADPSMVTIPLSQDPNMVSIPLSQEPNMVSIPLSQDPNMVSIPLSQDPSLGRVIHVSLENELVSDGLVTVDTSVISPRKRKIDVGDGGKCSRRKVEEDTCDGILGDVVVEGRGMLSNVVVEGSSSRGMLGDVVVEGSCSMLYGGDEQFIAMTAMTEVGQEEVAATWTEVGQEEVAVNWQEWEKEGDSQVVEFPESTTTINLRDLE